MNIGPIILRNQIEDLMNVKGIGEKKFLKLKSLVTIVCRRTRARCRSRRRDGHG
jgi:DNA repair protein RadC